MKTVTIRGCTMILNLDSNEFWCDFTLDLHKKVSGKVKSLTFVLPEYKSDYEKKSRLELAITKWKSDLNGAINMFDTICKSDTELTREDYKQLLIDNCPYAIEMDLVRV